MTPSPSAWLGVGGRWVWGGSGAGDGGGRGCGGSGTNRRSPGSTVRWAGECRQVGVAGRLAVLGSGRPKLGAPEEVAPRAAPCFAGPGPRTAGGRCSRKEAAPRPSPAPLRHSLEGGALPQLPRLGVRGPECPESAGGKGPPCKEASLAGGLCPATLA